MAPGATDEDIAGVVARVEGVGGEAFVSKGVTRTIIGLVGDIDSFHHLNLRTLPGVADVHRISDPYKLVSRQHHPDRSTVWVGPSDHRVPIGLVHAERERPGDPVGIQDPLELLVLAARPVDVVSEVEMSVEELGVGGQHPAKLVVVARKQLLGARKRLVHGRSVYGELPV